MSYRTPDFLHHRTRQLQHWQAVLSYRLHHRWYSLKVTALIGKCYAKTLVQSFLSFPTGKPVPIPNVQSSNMTVLTQQQSAEQIQRRDAVKQVFLRG
jgi:hypothetical protein